MISNNKLTELAGGGGRIRVQVSPVALFPSLSLGCLGCQGIDWIRRVCFYACSYHCCKGLVLTGARQAWKEA